MAERNYLLTTQADFAAAIENNRGVESGAKVALKTAINDPKVAQKTALQGARSEHARNEKPRESLVKLAFLPCFPGSKRWR